MTTLTRRPRVTAVVSASLLVMLVFAATGLGLRMPGLGFLSPVREEALGYESIRGGERFSPLRDAFVTRALGADTDTEPTFPGARDGQPGQMTARGFDPAVLRHSFMNDDFSRALVVPRVPFTATTDTQAATREAGEPSACAPTGGTVWYRYTPSSDATLIADTFGTRYGDALGIFTGSEVATLHEEACDTGPTGSAQVTLRVRAGVTYSFQITGIAGGGALRFNVQPLGTTHQIDGAPDGGTSPIPAGDGPVVSRDGRYVALVAAPANHTPGCPEQRFCHFVRDLVTGRMTLLAVSQAQPYPVYPAPDYSFDLSADGRYLAFTSDDPNLVPGDTNRTLDVFVVDRTTLQIERVSVSSTGAEAHVDPVQNSRTPFVENLSGSIFPSVSSDGRFIAFASDADNLSAHPTDGSFRMYVRDRVRGRTELVSIDEHGNPMSSASRYVRAISGSGRYVVFSAGGHTYLRDRVRGESRVIGPSSSAAVSEDGRKVVMLRTSDGLAYVYVYDVASRRETMASVSSDGTPHGSARSPVVGPGTSTFPRVSISSDGRYVAFDSYAPDLAPGDKNGVDDVFVHDLKNRTTTLVSLRSDGSQLSADSYGPAISGDGRVVGFLNDASNRHVFAHVSVVAGRS
jgi:Tol biopolymer transport system component